MRAWKTTAALSIAALFTAFLAPRLVGAALHPSTRAHEQAAAQVLVTEPAPIHAVDTGLNAPPPPKTPPEPLVDTGVPAEPSTGSVIPEATQPVTSTPAGIGDVPVYDAFLDGCPACGRG